MVDLVYPLGSGSKHSDAELKYSLLSARRFLKNAGTIFVVGDYPRFGESPVPFTHVPAGDPSGYSQQNARAKLEKICGDERVSEKFLLMNDDFFLLREYDAENFPYYQQGSLDAQIKRREAGEPGEYLDALRLTERLLSARGPQPLDFEIHCPFIYERAKLSALLGALDSPAPGYLLRSLYANNFDVPNVEHEDCKLRPFLNFEQIIAWTTPLDFFSTSDRSMNCDMKKFLAWRFGKEFKKGC